MEIDERFGRKLPMTTILEAPTIAALAPIVAGTEGGPRESLRLLRAGTAGGPSLFLVHDGDGETLLYMNLARRLPEDISVYGLEPRGDLGVPIVHTRIPEMAAHYLEQVRKVQPEGPYLLGGMCAGGTIAFEMALQLEAQGEPVGFVALLDSAAPLVPARPNREADQRRERLRQAMRDDPGNGSRLARVLGKLSRVAKKAKGFATYQASTHARAWKVGWPVPGGFAQAAEAGKPVPGFARGLSVRRVYERAEAEYIPSRRLEGQAVLFRASAGVGHDTPFIEIFESAWLGWERWVDGTVELREMPGGHSSMLQEPNVSVMAERVRECLADVVAVEVGVGAGA